MRHQKGVVQRGASQAGRTYCGDSRRQVIPRAALRHQPCVTWRGRGVCSAAARVAHSNGGRIARSGARSGGIGCRAAAGAGHDARVRRAWRCRHCSARSS